MAFADLKGELGRALAPLHNTDQLSALVQAAEIERAQALSTLATAVDTDHIRRLQGEVQTLDNLISLPGRLKTLWAHQGR